MEPQAHRYNSPNLMRAAFFSLTLTLGGFLALEQLVKGSVSNFIQVSLIMCFVFVIELYTSWQYYDALQLNAHERPQRKTLLIHHLLLPISTYLSVLTFAYFNRNTGLEVALLVLSFILFTILFVNIRAYYLYKKDLQLHTNYIYDIVKLLLFFCASDTIFNLINNQLRLTILLIPLVTGGLVLLLTMRYEKLELKSLNLIGIITFLLTLIAVICIVVLNLTPIQSSLISFLSFYLSTAALHHYFERDLNLNLIVEYLSIIIIAILLVYGVNVG